MEDTTDADYVPGKGVCKDFQTKNLSGYYDLYTQNDTLQLADVFSNFQNMCLEIYTFDPDHFLLAPELA